MPNLLGVVAPHDVLPKRTIDVARMLRLWVVETPKVARAFLKSLDPADPIAALDIVAIGTGDDSGIGHALERLASGTDVGMLSDAGCPGVADPGALLVSSAHRGAIRIVPLVGPSAILLALMAAGMNGQHFCFHGYLPVKSDARAEALRRIEQASRTQSRTELFIETPYRNTALLRAMADTLSSRTSLCIAADLTLATETIERKTVSQWRGDDARRFDRRPAIFLLQA